MEVTHLLLCIYVMKSTVLAFILEGSSSERSSSIPDNKAVFCCQRVLWWTTTTRILFQDKLVSGCIGQTKPAPFSYLVLEFKKKKKTRSISWYKYSGWLYFFASSVTVSWCLTIMTCRTVRLWDPNTGELLSTLRGHTKGLHLSVLKYPSSS
jgi:hypothetical protein